MRHPSLGLSIQQLLLSVRKLEQGMAALGLPRWMARLPVSWLCWYYCRLLDRKIARIVHIAGRIAKWRASLQSLGTHEHARTELLDLDRSMRADLEATRSVLWELREASLDVVRVFDSLGYSTPGLQRRQQAFLAVLEESHASAGVMQQLLTAHDELALFLLRQMQEGARSC